MIRTQKVRLYPNSTMKKALDELCDYRRFCWNQGLALWNEMYDASLLLDDKKLRPSERKVRDEMVHNKQDWQYQLSSRTLQLAISDLGKAWKNFFNRAQPDWGKPKFKSKKAPRQGFKTDQAKLVNGKLRLDKPRDIKITGWQDIKITGAKSLKGELKVISVYRENGRYWASLPLETSLESKVKTHRQTAVDVNVGHFNYTAGEINTFSPHLQRLYKRIKHYQRQLARKRNVDGRKATGTNNYEKTRAKLQRDYRRVANIQHDLIQKFTTKLVNDYDQIVIEDLDVKQMQMSHVASKGLQRSLFGYFRQVLTYKCNWYGKELVLADRHYPSTQRCSACGNIKQGMEKITLAGNAKHHTKHNEYICYKCGAVMDRDENAVNNLLTLIQ
ncbi:RNA-guided endonuclease InsQ/TnpB family protein [Limosilactobacillus fermentum]|uniref:RNA-guided endonuclease InsQ/TnpB family protein n=1 Tax=Limosilactobacillus fermentum TaxID=1613 RepID=UPI001E5DB6D1|nr:transposase [Limosilactobacillus fermentum]MCD5422989.1 transposase [Limosilactobacillus fermentum]